jgi:hypothetical protein
MITGRITVNGQHYDSPDEMPPSVRQMYELALKATQPALDGAQGSESTQVITGRGLGMNASIVTHEKVIVKKNVADLPPDLRELAQEAMKNPAATADPAHPGVRVSFKITRSPQVKMSLDDRTARDDNALLPGSAAPIEPSSIAIGVRNLLTTAVLLFLGGLAVWLFVNR